MNMKHYSSIEQSKKLLELGLDPETADLIHACYSYIMHTNKPTDNFKYTVILKDEDRSSDRSYDIPCWSVGALLGVLPEYELIHPSSEGEYLISIGRIIAYATDDGETFVDLLFNTIVYLLENGHIKKVK